MYNGVGLTTTRGSGSSGHVQTNKFNFRRRDHGGQRRNAESNPTTRSSKANEDILDHERKRKIELEVFKLRDDLEEEGKLSEEQIEEQVAQLRAKLESEAAKNKGNDRGKGKGRAANLKQETHAVADRKKHQMAKLARALRVNPNRK